MNIIKKHTPFALCALQSEDYTIVKQSYKLGILLLDRGIFSDNAIENVQVVFRQYNFMAQCFTSKLCCDILNKYTDTSCKRFSSSNLRLFIAEVSFTVAKLLLPLGCSGVADSSFENKSLIYGTQTEFVNLLWCFSHLYTVDLVPCCSSEVNGTSPQLFLDKFYNDFVIYFRDVNGRTNFVCKAIKPKSVGGVQFERRADGEYILSTTRRVAILKPNKQRHDIRNLGFSFMLDFNYGSFGTTETYIYKSKFVTKAAMWVVTTQSWKPVQFNTEEICGFKLI